jgi:hypothetical protein
MFNMINVLRREFSRKKFGLEFDKPEAFCEAQVIYDQNI